MPIRPENAARYPKDWPQISLRIRSEAGHRCVCVGECGLRHWVNAEGRQIDLEPELQVDACPPMRCTAENGKPHPVTGSKVVLTVGHRDHTPENVADENLRCWCQRCHNRYDAAERRRGIQQRQREASAVGDLFGGALCKPDRSGL